MYKSIAVCYYTLGLGLLYRACLRADGVRCYNIDIDNMF